MNNTTNTNLADSNTDRILKDKEEVSLKEILLKVHEWFRYLLTKWMFIFFIGGIGGAIGLYQEWYKKPLYMARIDFVLENSKSGNDIGGLASVFGLDIGGGGAAGEIFSGSNMFDLMKSKNIFQKIMLSPYTTEGKEMSFADFYIEFKGYRKKWAKDEKLKDLHFPPNSNPEKFSLEQNSVMNELYSKIIKKDITINNPKGSSGFPSIQLVSENELFAKKFIETMLSVVSDYYIKTKISKSLENFQILQNQTDSMRRIMHMAISDVASSIDINPNMNLSRIQQLKAPSQKKQVDVQATQTLYLQMIQNLEMAKISLRKETPLVHIVDAPTLPLEITMPNRLGAIIYGGIIGAIVGMVILILRRSILQILNS